MNGYRSLPIEIDRLSKTIKIYDDHPGFEDTISTSSGEYIVEFSEWDYQGSEYPACIIISDDCIKVNTSYPPFRDRKYGKIIIHLAINLVKTTKNNEIEKSFMKRVLLNWVKEITVING